MDQALARLQSLVTGMEVGDRLPSETRLAADLGVGRSTVREAVRVLAHLGMVESRQGSGTYVLSPAPSDLQRRMFEARAEEVFEARSELESAIARLAAVRRSARALTGLKASLKRCERAAETGDVDAFLAADADFHSGVVEAAGNPVLAEIYGELRSAHAVVASVVAPYVDLTAAVALHEALLHALAQGDAAAADAATRAHLADTWARLQAVARRPAAP